MLQYPKFDPVALQIGPLAIHWYGLMYLLGFALVYFLGRRRITRGHTTSPVSYTHLTLPTILLV